MSDPDLEQWQKELKVLLERIRSHPSADLATERERVVVLEQMIAGRVRNAG